ncbi:hypothetical protein C1645_839424 [Glomus cerebriforme]|uniref:Uncharacterized protein n=1 Tax=Glomus cerebriforme TaxID=658196 RepID=A0A397S0M3_9GLOM|nr:hypothetical protein C1645_839424 [Glomus cerebriforme]
MKVEQRFTFSPMTEIFQYDITWSLKKATAADITTILGHSAVLSKFLYMEEFTLIMIQHTFYNLKEQLLCWILLMLVWSQLKDANAPKLAFHTGQCYDYLFCIMEFPSFGSKANEQIYTFDLEDPDLNPALFFPLNTTITSPLPTKSPYITSSDQETNQSSSPNRMVIVLVSISLVTVVFTMCVVCSLVYKRMRNKINTEEESNGQGDFSEVRIQTSPDDDKQQYNPVHASQ